MRPSSIFFLSSVLLPQVVVSEGTIQEICNGIKNVWGCTAKIELPTGAAAKMCPQKFFEVRASKLFLLQKTVSQAGI